MKLRTLAVACISITIILLVAGGTLASIRQTQAALSESIPSLEKEGITRATSPVLPASANPSGLSDYPILPLVSFVPLDWASNLVVQDGYAYVVGTQFSIVSLADVSAPIIVSTLPDGCRDYVSVEVHGDRVYYKCYKANPIYVVSIADKAHPQPLSSFYLPPGGEGGLMSVVEPFAYVTEWGQLYIVSFENVAAPRVIGWFSCGWLTGSGWCWQVMREGNYVFVGIEAEGWLVVLSIADPEHPREIARYGPWNMGWAAQDNFVMEGDLILVPSDSFDMIDIADPQHPRRTFASGGVGTQIKDVAVCGHIAFGVGVVTAFGWPLVRMFDVSNTPRLLGSWTPEGIQEPSSPALRVQCDGRYLYVTDYPGLYIYAISNFLPNLFQVSGQVHNADDTPVLGVTITDNAGHVTTTDTRGKYRISGLLPGAYTLTVSGSGYTFSPSSHRVSVPPDAAGQDFVATRGTAISHIEITQATQDESNDVPLITGKPTFVRVYLDCGEGCTTLLNVAGVLHGYGPVEELSGSPISPIVRSVTAYHETWQSQRGDLSKTLNFTLPPEWLTGTITVTAEVEGVRISEGLTFQPARSLNAIYVPIRYKNQNPDSVRIQNGFSWASRIYPTAKINYLAGSTLEWNACLEKSVLCPSRNSNAHSLLNELTTLYRLVNVSIFGWLPEGTYGGGISDPTWNGGVGKAAFGDDHPREGSRIFAHEIGHLLGRRHTNTSSCQPTNIDPKSDWPYSNSLIQEYGLDAYSSDWLTSSASAIKNPSTSYDYMSYCGSLTNGDVWTSSWTYQHIYDEALKPAATGQVLEQISPSQTYFIASGLVFTDSTAILNPAWVITATMTPSNPPIGAAYCLEAYNITGMVLVGRCFDLNFIDYESGEVTNVANFNLMLPYPPGVTRIVLKKGATELAVRPVSAHAPVVNVVSPNGGETWAVSGTYTITWTASDLDGDPLTYSVLYSPDGDNWVPVGTTITGTHLAVNAAELAGGIAARVRVLATDGVNTSSDESDAAFTVGRKRPAAFILVPEGEVRFMPGTPLWLQGYGYDLEDGTLEGAALRWRSDRDGDLGAGSQVLVTLSPGPHVVTLTAIDKDGNTATASINVYAGGEIYLPLSLRTR